MKLVIDIPDYDIELIKEYYEGHDTVSSTYSYIYHGQPLSEILDKISAEIEERIAVYDNWQTQRECTATEANTMREALAIVKKYMAESEGKE